MITTVRKENGLLNSQGDLTSEYYDVPDTPVKDRSTTPGIDKTVVIEMKNGSHEAFDKVFHTFYPRVRSFLRVMTKSEDMADEVSQKVFVNLWLYRASINPERNFNAYVYTMARNAALTAIKSQLRDTLNIFETADEAGTALSDDQLIARETELLIKMTVSRMPPKRKQVYELSRCQFKTNDEISQELNISKKVVERHLRLALADIKEVVKVMVAIFFV